MKRFFVRIGRHPRTLPTFIFVLLSLPVFLHASVMVLAEQHPSLVVDGEYFQTPDQQARTRRALADFEGNGWTVHIGSVSRSPVDGGFGFELAVVDAQGRPVDGFEYSVDAFHHARARHVQRAEVREVEGSAPRIHIPVHRRGRWDIRIAATHEAREYPLVRSIWVP